MKYSIAIKFNTIEVFNSMRKETYKNFNKNLRGYGFSVDQIEDGLILYLDKDFKLKGWDYYPYDSFYRKNPGNIPKYDKLINLRNIKEKIDFKMYIISNELNI